MINSENWCFAQYINGEDSALISLGMDPLFPESLIYFLTRMKKDNTLSQLEYKDLDHAVLDINKKFGHWRFVELPSFKEESKCSSCH